MRDEGELIRAAAGGDVDAVNELVRLKRELVVRVAYQVTGNWEDAVDVSQGVFVRLWKGGLSRYDPQRRFDTWLYRITMNAAIDHVRSRGRHLQPLPDEPAELKASATATAASAEPAADAALDRLELRAAFATLSARLPTKQRTAFVLREIEGLETAEVARIMDVAESTVRNHLLQARRALREGLEREYRGLVPVARRRDADEGDAP
jgi:RNA polymerase sigma-70 factor (ECF subfamily)